jgi:hypothetical protein
LRVNPNYDKYIHNSTTSSMSRQRIVFPIVAKFCKKCGIESNDLDRGSIWCVCKDPLHCRLRVERLRSKPHCFFCRLCGKFFPKAKAVECDCENPEHVLCETCIKTRYFCHWPPAHEEFLQDQDLPTRGDESFGSEHEVNPFVPDGLQKSFILSMSFPVGVPTGLGLDLMNSMIPVFGRSPSASDEHIPESSLPKDDLPPLEEVTLNDSEDDANNNGFYSDSDLQLSDAEPPDDVQFQFTKKEVISIDPEGSICEITYDPEEQ